MHSPEKHGCRGRNLFVMQNTKEKTLGTCTPPNCDTQFTKEIQEKGLLNTVLDSLIATLYDWGILPNAR